MRQLNTEKEIFEPDSRIHIPVSEMGQDTYRYNGWHRHACPRCELIWAHDGAIDRPPLIHNAAHVCPRCGCMDDDVLDCVQKGK